MTTIRLFIRFSLALGFFQILIPVAWPQAYPVKPVRIIVPGSAGSGDTLARLIADGMSQVMGQQSIVEARPGANGIIATDIAAKSPADGYTVFLANIAQAASVSLYRNLPFDLERDFSAVTQVVSSPHVLILHPSLPVTSVKDLIQLAKLKPGTINYSSVGVGSSTFLAAELFKSQAQVDILHIPYKGGGPALTALLSGETSVYLAPLASALPQIRANTVRALAVTTAKRIPLTADIQTVAEAGLPGYEFANWYGFLVPAKTPKERIAALRSATISALNRDEVRKRIMDLSYITVGDQSEEFSAYIKTEIAKLTKLTRDLRLTVDAPL